MTPQKSKGRARQAKSRVLKGDRVKVIRGNHRDSEILMAFLNEPLIARFHRH